MQPLIVTARLAPDVQAVLDAMRTRYFPPERNYLDAHLTLLHHLPAAHSEALGDVLSAACEVEPLQAHLKTIRPWATGFAVVIAAPALVALHKRLVQVFYDVLTEQDKAPLWPHVTLQNKTPKAESRLAFQSAHAAFIPQDTSIVAIDVWRYEDGPWTHLNVYPYGAMNHAPGQGPDVKG